jgi:3-oxoacyl-[acyl-carrier protein] reductase
MDKELDGRVAIVTGAGRNIGRAIARALAEGGAAVVVNARANRSEAEAVAGEIERGGGKALAITGDVTSPDAVRATVAGAVERFGRIDILVNNAAVRIEQPFEAITLEEWRAVTSIIIEGAFNCVQACLPQLKQSGSAAIVNIGGLSAHTGAARRAHVVTAKAGLAGLTRALAHELAEHKIRVNSVTPGLMALARPPGQPTPQHHSFVNTLVGRRGLPEDIGATVRFLCGPGAGYITGQNIQVNGGTYLG